MMNSIHFLPRSQKFAVHVCAAFGINLFEFHVIALRPSSIQILHTVLLTSGEAV